MMNLEFGEAYPYVIVAYMGIWAVLFAYVFYLLSRMSRVEEEIGLLSRIMKKKEEE
jgi:CcmD family protein